MILAGSLGPPEAAQHSTAQYSTVQHYVPLEQQSSSRSPPHFPLSRLPMVQLLTSRSWQVRPCIAATKTSSYTEEAKNDPSVLTITKKALTRAFSQLKAPTSAFTLKTLITHYAKQALTHSK